MNQERDNAPRLIIIVAATLAAVGLILIVMLAIASDALPQLIGGVVVLGLIVIALVSIGVVLFKAFGKTWIDILKENHRHTEDMTSKGYPPNNDRYRDARQLKPSSEPAPLQLDRPAKGIQFDTASLDVSVTNLLLFSMQLLGEDSKRIASNPECAAAQIPGYNGRKWNMMINDYLKPKYKVVAVPGPIENGGGAYVPDEIGSIGALYKLVVRNSAVDALPEGKRR